MPAAPGPRPRRGRDRHGRRAGQGPARPVASPAARPPCPDQVRAGKPPPHRGAGRERDRPPRRGAAATPGGGTVPVVMLLNPKGGVGKTNTCHHPAGTLAGAGRRVLLVDNDPQASLTMGSFGPEATRATRTPASTGSAGSSTGAGSTPPAAQRPTGSGTATTATATGPTVSAPRAAGRPTSTARPGEGEPWMKPRTWGQFKDPSRSGCGLRPRTGCPPRRSRGG